ncbi:hypothetical protein BKA65DRAFT_61006 [Rhexocercosporidium sp. MPI-PUGE-AT-0058]|nr:hypothetical protein BKA65DRAFT_61006 [Rhexocercosporidium sp. MPI-PUGE-AT-0058]
MERKRKLPARAARVESVSKKRTSTPPDQRTQTPTPPAPPPQPAVPAPVEESLPRSIAPGKPLPTVEAPQPENLPSSQFQTIPESGVLVESLHRSRHKWLSEGIFEKYWTKPTKKKGAPDAPPDNPAKDSMTKLGSCSITVEPHTFEATMYAIKDPNPKPLLATVPPPQQQMRRPIIQYGPPGGVMPPNPPPAPVQPVQQKPPPPIPQASPRSQDVQMQNTAPAPPNNAYSQGQQTPNPLPNSNRPPPLQLPTATRTPQPAPPPTPVGKSTDPVIQMLAERAATDPSLKALMRIVANGEATAEELKRFQSHIDELTRLQKARQAAEAVPSPPPTNQVPSTQQSIQQTNGNHPQPFIQASNPTPPMKVAPTPPPPAPTPTPQFQPQPQALRSKGPVPSSKPDISGVVFEFSGGNGDRYSFPKFSILETRPNGEVIVSFLIVRKGSSSDCPTYDPELDYYQPITIRLYAHQPRQLDALQKIVAPPEEVRRYMDDIMDKATRAEYVLLAMRLPKDTEQPPAAEKEEESEKADVMDYQITPWATTTSTPVPIHKLKPAKKLPTEEEVYQSFIKNVT